MPKKPPTYIAIIVIPAQIAKRPLMIGSTSALSCLNGAASVPDFGSASSFRSDSSCSTRCESPC